MQPNLWWWIIFNAGVLGVLAIDLFAFQRKAHAPSRREAATWTLLWVTLSLAFNAVIRVLMGPAKALQFLTGYLLEYSLSVDNIFVFVLTFSYFAVPAAYQHRVLFWGILSALLLRGVMIGVGAAFIGTFHWALYFFAGLLILTGAKMLFRGRKAVNLAQNPVVRRVCAWLPMSDDYHGARFTARSNGRRLLTPLAVVLIIIEATDLLFAIDSIPAIFGITHDPFIVYTSSVCAILGLRSLYFLLSGLVHKFVYLEPALAIILFFIGVKILLADFLPIPTAASLAFIGLVLLAGIGLSLRKASMPRVSRGRSERRILYRPLIRTMTTDKHCLQSPLSTELEVLRLNLKDQSLTLDKLKQALAHRGWAMLLVILSLPFCFVAIPGLSIPFGIAICCIGLHMMIGREPWLPRFIMHRRLSTARSHQLLTAAIRMARMLESFVRPRLGFFHKGQVVSRLIGLAIVIAGLGLMLPLPIPFSNSLPAWAVVLLAVGMLEKDGLCVLLGHLTAVATWIFIGLTSVFAIEGFRRLLDSAWLTE